MLNSLPLWGGEKGWLKQLSFSRTPMRFMQFYTSTWASFGNFCCLSGWCRKRERRVDNWKSSEIKGAGTLRGTSWPTAVLKMMSIYSQASTCHHPHHVLVVHTISLFWHFAYLSTKSKHLSEVPHHLAPAKWTRQWNCSRLGSFHQQITLRNVWLSSTISGISICHHTTLEHTWHLLSFVL